MTRAEKLARLDLVDSLIAEATVKSLARANSLMDGLDGRAKTRTARRTARAATPRKYPRLEIKGDARGLKRIDGTCRPFVTLDRSNLLAAMDAMGIDGPLLIRWRPHSEFAQRGAEACTWFQGRPIIDLPDDHVEAVTVARALGEELAHVRQMLDVGGWEELKRRYWADAPDGRYSRSNRWEREAVRWASRWEGTFFRGADARSRAFPATRELAH